MGTNELQLTVCQTIFTIFYAITWGLVGEVQPRWKAFDWPRFFSEGRVFWRIAISILFFNIIPIAAFVGFFIWFGRSSWKISSYSYSLENVAKIGASVAPAFAIFGFYRLWLCIVEGWPDWFYYWLPRGFFAYYGAEDRIEFAGDEATRRRFSKINLCAGLLYIAVAVFLPLYVMKLFDVPLPPPLDELTEGHFK